MENLDHRWQSILQEYFPGVIVRINERIASQDVPFLDVFQLPDGKGGDFLNFIVLNGEELATKHHLAEPHFIPHSCSATKTHYGQITNEHEVHME